MKRPIYSLNLTNSFLTSARCAKELAFLGHDQISILKAVQGIHTRINTLVPRKIDKIKEEWRLTRHNEQNDIEL